MVVDTSGNISAYRHREKMKDGTWVWSDVDMNKMYQIVSETDNGYVITSDERYVRYLRNSDNSYAYVDCDSDGMIRITRMHPQYHQIISVYQEMCMLYIMSMEY